MENIEKIYKENINSFETKEFKEFALFFIKRNKDKLMKYLSIEEINLYTNTLNHESSHDLLDIKSDFYMKETKIKMSTGIITIPAEYSVLFDAILLKDTIGSDLLSKPCNNEKTNKLVNILDILLQNNISYGEIVNVFCIYSSEQLCSILKKIFNMKSTYIMNMCKDLFMKMYLIDNEDKILYIKFILLLLPKENRMLLDSLICFNKLISIGDKREINLTYLQENRDKIIDENRFNDDGGDKSSHTDSQSGKLSDKDILIFNNEIKSKYDKNILLFSRILLPKLFKLDNEMSKKDYICSILDNVCFLIQEYDKITSQKVY